MKKYFKIEEFTDKYSDYKDYYGRSLPEIREKNKEMNRLLNYGVIRTEEEFLEIKLMYDKGHSIEEIVEYFQRNERIIKGIIKGTRKMDKLKPKRKYPTVFFQIEKENEEYNHGIYTSKGKPFDIIKKREDNRLSGRLLNSGFPIKKEEVIKVKEMSLMGFSISELELFFQRSGISLQNIIDGEYDEIKEGNHQEELINVNLKVEISQLTKVEIIILKSLWGLGLEKPLKINEIGSLLGKSNKQILNIEKKIYDKIKYIKGSHI